MLLAAQRAKDDYTNVQCTAREAVGLGGQSLFSGSDTKGVSAVPSQAETTLTKYSQSGGRGSGPKNVIFSNGTRINSEYPIPFR